EVTSQVLGAFFHGLDVAGAVIAGFIDLIQGQATVVFHGAYRGDDGHGVGGKSAGRTGDVHEFLGTQIRTEAGFGDDGIGQIKSGVGSNHRVRTVGDIGEWTTVNQRRSTGQSLHEVWTNSIAQQNGHANLSTIGAKFRGRHWFAVISFSDHDARETFFEVVQVARQAEDGHRFGGHGNFEVIFAGRSGGATPQADGHVTQVAVVHIQYALDAYCAGVDPKFVAVENVVIHQVAQ